MWHWPASEYLGSSHTQMPHQETRGPPPQCSNLKTPHPGFDRASLGAVGPPGPLPSCCLWTLHRALRFLLISRLCSRPVFVCTQVSVSWCHFPSETISKGTHTSQQEEARPTCHNRSGLRSKSKTNGGVAVWREGGCPRKSLPRQGCWSEQAEPVPESHAHPSTCS